jgi:transketolase
VISPAGKETADALLLATGSEVGLAVEAQQVLAGEGIAVAVVSMPSWDRFDAQSKEYKESVLPKNVKKRLGI